MVPFRCTLFAVKQAAGYSLAALAVDPRLSTPLHRQLYERIRTAILGRQLRGGIRLPSTRTLAIELGVSRNTVLSAFEQLIAEGYLDGKVGSGTYVASAIPDDLLSLRRRATAKAIARRQPRLSQRASNFRSITTTAGRRRPFEPGIPAVDLFPTKVWARLLSRQWGKSGAAMFDALAYGEPAGLLRLRENIARYVGAARGVTCEPAQVIITNGLQHGLEIAARVLLDPGDTVWFEDPGYPAARATLQSAGATVELLPVDEGGLNVEYGITRCASPRLIYVTPSHQYPLGVTMPAARRLELLEVARTADAWVLEDDYDSEYRHSTHPIHSIQGLDANERVIYLGTFSKVLYPSLRLGYVIVPPALVDAFTFARLLAGRTSPTIDQAVLADFIEEGYFERHIRRMRSAYRERQEALLDAANKSLGGMVTIHPPQAGMHVIGWLQGIDDKAASRAAAALNIEAAPLSAYCVDVKLQSGLLLGYGAVTPRQIRMGVETLARALSGLQSRRNS